jgi:hypothetical protein
MINRPPMREVHRLGFRGMQLAALSGTAVFLFAATAASAVSVFNANSAFVANEVPDGANTNPFGPFAVGHSTTPGGFIPFTAGQHTDNFIGANPSVEGYFIGNNVSVPAALVNIDTVNPVVTNFGVTLGPSQILLHPGGTGADGFTPPFSNGILRFTAPVAGNYTIAGDWQSLGSGNTVNSVLLNGAPLASSAALNSTFNMTHTLRAGETVDFVVNDGGDSIGSDSTGLRTTLTLQNPANAVYNAGADLKAFELANNGAPIAPVNGAWRYGTSDSLGSAFNPFSASEHSDSFSPATNPSAFQGWFEPGGDMVPVVAVNVSGAAQGSCCGTFAPEEIWMHGEDDASARTFDIIRWIAPADGTIDLSAIWVQKHSSAASIHALLNGVPGLFNGLATPGGTSFNASFAVLAGTTIDFAVGPNPQTGYGATSTGFNATINFVAAVPEPATCGLLLLGAALAGRRHRRHT